MRFSCFPRGCTDSQIADSRALVYPDALLDPSESVRVVFPAGEAGSCVCVCVFQAPFETNYNMVNSREILFFHFSILHVSQSHFSFISQSV